MRAAQRRRAKIGRPEVSIDLLALARGIRSGLSVSELARSLGVSWGTAKKAVAAELAKKVSSGSGTSETIATPTTT
jgi:hypothetical protein